MQNRRSEAPCADGLKIIQQQVGHEHASTTSIYTGLSPDYRARVVSDAISRMAGEALATQKEPAL